MLPQSFHITIHPISAPARGATRVDTATTTGRMYFNQCTRKGCDLGVIEVLLDMDDFNQRTRKGCDMCSRMCLEV